MSELQSKIRREIIRAEQALMISLEWVNIYREIGWVAMEEKHLRDYNHFDGRRRYFLGELLSVQIKEFDRGT